MAASMTSVRAQATTARQSAARPAFRVSSVRPSKQVCQALPSGADEVAINRRNALLASIASVAAANGAMPSFAFADEGAAEYAKLIGYATPPTSYGGYGGNAAETPRYTFEYPANWKQEVPNKVEKGTQGIDSRVVSPRGKEFKAFVISLTRAGEDGARFRLTDLDSTLSSFAGADYDLQDAVSSATNKTTNRREDNGNEYYEYDIESPEFHYLSSIAVKNGKVFALFVRAPSKSFKANEEKLRHIITTFTLL